jgi:hypothetical protein
MMSGGIQSAPSDVMNALGITKFISEFSFSYFVGTPRGVGIEPPRSPNDPGIKREV